MLNAVNARLSGTATRKHRFANLGNKKTDLFFTNWYGKTHHSSFGFENGLFNAVQSSQRPAVVRTDLQATPISGLSTGAITEKATRFGQVKPGMRVAIEQVDGFLKMFT